jgi:hypothetical protein
MTEIPEHLVRRPRERRYGDPDPRIPQHLIQRAAAARAKAAYEAGESFNASWIPQLPQRQDSTTDQLRDLIAVANRLGMYDAAEWIEKGLGPWPRPK